MVSSTTKWSWCFFPSINTPSFFSVRVIHDTIHNHQTINQVFGWASSTAKPSGQCIQQASKLFLGSRKSSNFRLDDRLVHCENSSQFSAKKHFVKWIWKFLCSFSVFSQAFRGSMPRNGAWKPVKSSWKMAVPWRRWPGEAKADARKSDGPNQKDAGRW